MNRIVIVIIVFIVIIYVINLIVKEMNKAENLKAGKKWEDIMKELSNRK
tara:strand:+ start:1089 stop:1235 length:147 start_codon:yes stop_codon:yes gene_type:complete